MNREVHVPFCERLPGQFRRPTHHSLHWVLDVAFREDDCRVRKGYGAENLAVLRHIALNAVKQEKTAKLGVKNKRLRAGWDEPYLAKILAGI